MISAQAAYSQLGMVAMGSTSTNDFGGNDEKKNAAIVSKGI